MRRIIGYRCLIIDKFSARLNVVGECRDPDYLYKESIF